MSIPQSRELMTAAALAASMLLAACDNDTGSTALPTRNSRVAEASRASTVMDSLAAVSPAQADSKPAASRRRPKSPASGSAKPVSGSSIPQRMARG